MDRTSEYGKSVAFRKGTPVIFSDFSITFIDETASAKTFVVQDSGGNTFTLKETGGPASPQPIEFSVNNKGHFTLLTYQLPNGARLHPNHLAIIKK